MEVSAQAKMAVSEPVYWEMAKAGLMKRDRIMRRLIPKFGDLHLRGRGEAFTTLTRSIVGQQISLKAAEAVWERMQLTCCDWTAEEVLQTGAEKLAACGLSKRKTEYILDLAEHFHANRLHADQWAKMEDEAVIADLTQVRGIGRWTAEMFLIFNLLRPNVLPLDDLGLMKAISLNYFSGDRKSVV